jgi:hypothetical protein
VLKGLVTGPLDYPATSLRQTSDVDVLVAPEQLRSAERVLVAHGCTPPSAVGLPGPMVKGPTLRHPSGFEIDLHFRFEPMFAMIPLGVFGTPPDRTPGGLRALSPELRLIHAAVHTIAAIPTHRHLSSLADVVAVIDNTGVDWDRAGALAAELGVLAPVAEALRMEAAIMERPHHPGLDWPGLAPLEEATLLSSRRRMFARHLMRLRHLPPGVSRSLYFRTLLLPPGSAITARGGLVGHVRSLSRGVWD